MSAERFGPFRMTWPPTASLPAQIAHRTMPETSSALDTIIQSSTVDLFHSCGIALAPLPRKREQEVPPRYELTGTIAFHGRGFTGTLTLSVPKEAFSLVRQDPHRPFRDWDWVRELTNQLLGRIKNRLTQFQVGLTAGLPSVMSSDVYDRQRNRSEPLAIYRFRTLRGEIIVTLNGAIDPAVFVYSGTGNLATEGDIILF